MIISAIRVIVNVQVTPIETCGSLASTVSDSESDDDAFLGPPCSWFVLIDDRLKNQTASKHRYGLPTQDIVNK